MIKTQVLIVCGGIPHGIVPNMLNCDIVGGKTELQLCYYHAHLVKGMNPFIPSSYKLNSTITVLLQEYILY